MIFVLCQDKIRLKEKKIQYGEDHRRNEDEPDRRERGKAEKEDEDELLSGLRENYEEFQPDPEEEDWN